MTTTTNTDPAAVAAYYATFHILPPKCDDSIFEPEPHWPERADVCTTPLSETNKTTSQ